MVSLRFPFVARRMVVELRLETTGGCDASCEAVLTDRLEAIHRSSIARRELRRTQMQWDREKIYSGSMMLR